ncbi:MAG: hypothetical protein AB2A00_19190 [Myxococcota bacterium]
MWSSIRAHPVLTFVVLACTALGVVLAVPFAPPEWSLVRGVAAGAIGGAGVGYLIVASRTIGAFGDDA